LKWKFFNQWNSFDKVSEAVLKKFRIHEMENEFFSIKCSMEQKEVIDSLQGHGMESRGKSLGAVAVPRAARP
jgi:hypothetical protein